jgi:hypothetical protein
MTASSRWYLCRDDVTAIPGTVGACQSRLTPLATLGGRSAQRHHGVDGVPTPERTVDRQRYESLRSRPQLENGSPCFSVFSSIGYKHALVVHAARYAEKLKLARNLKVGGSNPPRSNIKDLRDSLLPLEAALLAPSQHTVSKSARKTAQDCVARWPSVDLSARRSGSIIPSPVL